MRSDKEKTFHGPIYKMTRALVRCFKKKPQITNLSKDLEQKAIFVSNHSAISGPLILSLYFPYIFVPWGTHEMTESFSKRFNYLYVTSYQQKLGYRKWIAFILSLMFATVSKMLYKGAKLIPTYPDTRLMRTLRLSEKYINDDIPVLVFPEDSSEGYKTILESYHPGFIAFSRYYYKKYQVDLPIYPIYYSKSHNRIIIGEKIMLQSLLALNYTKEMIADHVKEKTNALYLLMDKR